MRAPTALSLAALLASVPVVTARAEAPRPQQHPSACAGSRLSSAGLPVPVPKAPTNGAPTAADGDCPRPEPPPGLDAALAHRFRSMQIVAHQLSGQGVCCSDFNFTEGMACRGRIRGYPKDVLFFIPADYAPAEKADVILHFHGWLLGSTFNQTVVGRFQFQSLLARTGRNSILVVPENDADYGVFQKAFAVSKSGNGFTDFMNGVNGVLEALTTGSRNENHVRSIALTAHSAGYTAVEQVLEGPACAGEPCYRDKIHEAHLFDAAYGGGPGHNDPAVVPAITAFMNEPGNRFTNIYLTDNSTGTTSVSRYYEREYCRHKAGASASDADVAQCASRLETSPDPASRARFLGLDSAKLGSGGYGPPHWQALGEYFGAILAPPLPP